MAFIDFIIGIFLGIGLGIFLLIIREHFVGRVFSYIAKYTFYTTIIIGIMFAGEQHSLFGFGFVVGLLLTIIVHSYNFYKKNKVHKTKN